MTAKLMTEDWAPKLHLSEGWRFADKRLGYCEPPQWHSIAWGSNILMRTCVMSIETLIITGYCQSLFRFFRHTKLVSWQWRKQFHWTKSPLRTQWRTMPLYCNLRVFICHYWQAASLACWVWLAFGDLGFICWVLFLAVLWCSNETKTKCTIFSRIKYNFSRCT